MVQVLKNTKQKYSVPQILGIFLKNVSRYIKFKLDNEISFPELNNCVERLIDTVIVC